MPAPQPRKEPFFSLIISFFIPGLGTILNGEGRKGGAIMAVAYLTPVVALIGFFFFALRFDYPGNVVYDALLGFLPGSLGFGLLFKSLISSYGFFPDLYLAPLLVLCAIPVMIGAWVWGLIDAYKGAEAHNARYGMH